MKLLNTHNDYSDRSEKIIIIICEVKKINIELNQSHRLIMHEPSAVIHIIWLHILSFRTDFSFGCFFTSILCSFSFFVVRSSFVSSFHLVPFFFFNFICFFALLFGSVQISFCWTALNRSCMFAFIFICHHWTIIEFPCIHSVCFDGYDSRPFILIPYHRIYVRVDCGCNINSSFSLYSFSFLTSSFLRFKCFFFSVSICFVFTLPALHFSWIFCSKFLF